MQITLRILIKKETVRDQINKGFWLNLLKLLTYLPHNPSMYSNLKER